MAEPSILKPETLDRLEAQAAKQIGPDMTTAVAVTPGELRELVRSYRAANYPAESLGTETRA